MSSLFSDEAQRVTTEEMRLVYEELKAKVGGLFCDFQLTRTLEEKQDHGDIDILVLTHPEQNPRAVIDALEPKKCSRNGHCYSFLYESKLGKVHVDFLVSSDPNLHQTKIQYYAFNNLSSNIGMVAKTLNFKYGTEGFFKRYKDKRGQWHDLLVSINLNPGLECLGYEPKPLWIKTSQDIVNYVSSSLLFSSEMFAPEPLDDVGFLPGSLEEKLEQGGRNYLIGKKLFELGKQAVLTDPDYFFKRKYPAQYAEVQDGIAEIEKKAYRQSRFNGGWLMETFGLKPGKALGVILKGISDRFEEELDTVTEEEVIAFVKEIIDEQN
jgi:hypothetical protein